MNNLQKTIMNMNLNEESLDITFTKVCDAMLDNEFFGLPDNALRAIDSGNIEIALLGSKEFGESFYSCIKNKRIIKYVVDDFKSEKKENFLGIKTITTTDFIKLARNNKKLIGLNTCRYDFSKRFFEKTCRDKRLATNPHVR